ncbi:YncE family protein [Streptomyces asiaticus]|uniref:YncE family protein n=1 Tax=Streptomyces asiaticus TaxID=114695 RepID=UPI003813B525
MSPGPAAAVPPGGYAFVANLGSDTVSVINTSTKAVTTVRVGRGPAGVAVTPDGARVANSDGKSNSVSVIDTGTHTVIDTIGVGAYPSGVATAVVRAPEPTCAKATATITGTDGSDVITGTPGDDVIFALGGIP